MHRNDVQVGWCHWHGDRKKKKTLKSLLQVADLVRASGGHIWRVIQVALGIITFPEAKSTKIDYKILGEIVKNA
jgi:hypothetical protein